MLQITVRSKCCYHPHLKDEKPRLEHLQSENTLPKASNPYVANSQAGAGPDPKSHALTQDSTLKHLRFHPDSKEIARGKSVPSATDILVTVPLAAGFQVPFPFPPWKSCCLFPGSVWAGQSWLAEEGLRLALPQPSKCSPVAVTLAHLDALPQLSLQSSSSATRWLKSLLKGTC